MGGPSSTTSYHHHRPSNRGTSIHSFAGHGLGLYKAKGSLASVGYSVGEVIPQYIPGFKTSATFLSTLGANLRIPDSEAYFPSPISTPLALCAVDSYHSSSSIPPVSPILSAIPSLADHDLTSDSPFTLLSPGSNAPYSPHQQTDTRNLTTSLSTTDSDRQQALKLVSISIASQRDLAFRAVLTHPLHITASIFALTLACRTILHHPGTLALVLSICIALTLLALAYAYHLTRPYTALAQTVLADTWLDDDDVVITSRSGNELVGTLVLGWDPAVSEKGRGRRRRGGTGVIRAWTVEHGCRGRGHGRALLDAAVGVVKKRGGDGLEFERDGVYAQRVLPRFYNRSFDVRDERAQRALEHVIQINGGFGKRR